MISLELNKVRDFKIGEVVHLKIVNILYMAPGKWKLTAEDITPLPRAEPTGYGCHLCGIIEPALEDGGLPSGWVKKEFPERSFFLCPECQEWWAKICKVCGCSEEDPCEGGCSWVEEDLCSACAGKEGESEK